MQWEETVGVGATGSTVGNVQKLRVCVCVCCVWEVVWMESGSSGQFQPSLLEVPGPRGMYVLQATFPEGRFWFELPDFLCREHSLQPICKVRIQVGAGV